MKRCIYVKAFLIVIFAMVATCPLARADSVIDILDMGRSLNDVTIDGRRQGVYCILLEGTRNEPEYSIIIWEGSRIRRLPFDLSGSVILSLSVFAEGDTTYLGVGGASIGKTRPKLWLSNDKKLRELSLVGAQVVDEEGNSRFSSTPKGAVIGAGPGRSICEWYGVGRSYSITTNDGTTTLRNPFPHGSHLFVAEVSSDGGVIFGSARDKSGKAHGVAWNLKSETIELLPTPQAIGFDVLIRGGSSTGNYVAGAAGHGLEEVGEAVVWMWERNKYIAVPLNENEDVFQLREASDVVEFSEGVIVVGDYHRRTDGKSSEPLDRKLYIGYLDDHRHMRWRDLNEWVQASTNITDEIRGVSNLEYSQDADLLYAECNVGIGKNIVVRIEGASISSQFF